MRRKDVGEETEMEDCSWPKLVGMYVNGFSSFFFFLFPFSFSLLFFSVVCLRVCAGRGSML